MKASFLLQAQHQRIKSNKKHSSQTSRLLKLKRGFEFFLKSIWKQDFYGYPNYRVTFFTYRMLFQTFLQMLKFLTKLNSNLWTLLNQKENFPESILKKKLLMVLQGYPQYWEILSFSKFKINFCAIALNYYKDKLHLY